MAFEGASLMHDLGPRPIFGQINLEQVRLANRRLLEDLPGLHLETIALRNEAELHGMLLEMRAHVLASVRHETPYEVSDTVTGTVRVPARPIRDGLWLWLSQHMPWSLGPLFSRRVHWHYIPLRRQVLMRQNHYYCCPHLNSEVQGDIVHLNWLVDKQTTPES